MEISISNIIINYFLLHNELTTLEYIQLQQLIDLLQQELHIIVYDNNQFGLLMCQQLFEDFLKIDKNKTIHQSNILQFLQDLQPIYEWFSFGQWQKQQQYYKIIKNYGIKKA